MPYSSPSVNPTRHGEYYLQEGLTTFLVEDKLFRVHRFLFQRDSEFFKALFSLNPPSGCAAEGTCDNRPLSLPGVTVAEFEALLDAFYHGSSGTRSPQDHWPLLLSIATRYGFDETREQAIRGISSLIPPMDPVCLVELALHHDVSQWLESAYISLCIHPNPLTQPEVARVGHAIAKKIGRCRAEFIMTNRDASITRTPSGDKELARKIVRKVFWPYGPGSTLKAEAC